MQISLNFVYCKVAATCAVAPPSGWFLLCVHALLVNMPYKLSSESSVS